MKYVFALLAFIFLNIAPPAQAQDAMVVQTCGTLPQNYAPGATRLVTVDTTGKLCGTGGGGGTAGIQRIDGTSSTVPAMTAGSAMSDTDLVYCAQSGGTTDRKCTGAQVKTYANTSAVRATTTTSEALANSDQNKLVTFSNGSAVACTIAQAGSGGNFAAGWAVSLKNLGAGTVTCTPTTSTVDGAANFTLTTGQGVDLYSDGTNYFTQPGKGGGGTVTTTGSPANGNLAAFSGASSITNGNLSGDCTTSGTLSVICVQGRQPYVSGNYITSYFMGGGVRIAQIAGVVNTIRCFTGYVKGALHIDQIGIRVTAAVASGNAQYAIYAVNSATGKPTGNPLLNSNSLSTAATGIVTTTISSTALGSTTQSFTPLGFCYNNDTTAGTGVTSSGFNGDAVFLASDIGTATANNLFGTGGVAPISGWSTSQTFGTWPDLTGASWTDVTGGLVLPVMHISSIP